MTNCRHDSTSITKYIVNSSLFCGPEPVLDDTIYKTFLSPDFKLEVFNDLLENVFLPLQFLKPVFPASITQLSSLSVLVVVPLTSSLMGFPKLQKDSEFMEITVFFLDEKVNVVEQIRSAQGSNLSKETTRVVICLIIDP
ncbi:hypothetical protein HID58_083335 [Brassica napus]|uniref:Uncharacterized protein n=1 Tax=Brassica napus TaxID=3708 RepID=A0ABQ7YD85_BRANA|nr:hypothetical protein HID58_083335 [Brassica napus]